MRLKTLLICLSLILGGAALAQDTKVTRADLIEFMRKTPELTGSRERLTSQGFSGEKLALAEDHERRLMNDTVITGYIADRLLALNDGNLPYGWAPNGLMMPLFDNGFTHLPLADKKFHYQVQLAIMQNMPARECGLLVKGRISDDRMDRAIGKAEARLSASTLKRYYAIQRKAIRTGVSRAPKTLSPTDSARIQEQINSRLRKRLESDPSLRPAAQAFNNMNRASAKNACIAGQVFFDVVLGMKGRELEHALIHLNES